METSGSDISFAFPKKIMTTTKMPETTEEWEAYRIRGMQNAERPWTPEEKTAWEIALLRSNIERLEERIGTIIRRVSIGAAIATFGIIVYFLARP